MYIYTHIYKIAAGDKSEVKFCTIADEYQPADIFTKGLSRVDFQHHRRTIMSE